MDESTLLRALKSLEMSWSSLNWWMDFWTFIVVVGVVSEIFVVLREWRHDLQEFRRGSIHSPDKPRASALVVGLLGAALVAIGVAGELVVHLKAGKVETDMRDATDTLVALVDKEAGDAKTSAKGAADAADRAEGSANRADDLSSHAALTAGKAKDLATGARQEAESFERDIVSAKKQAAAAESHLADALKRAAEAETSVEAERASRQESMAYRTISDDQRKHLVENLKGLEGQSVEINFQGGDPEIAGFANALNSVLKEAGMLSTARWVRDWTYSPGISMWFGEKRLSSAAVIARALIISGLAPRPIPRVSGDPNQELRLLIGPKELLIVPSKQ